MKIQYLLFLLFLSSAEIQAQNALNFDGVDDRLVVSNDPSLQISGNAISLEAWIFPTAWTSQVWQGNIINKENNGPDYGYMLRCGANGSLNFNLGNGSWNEITTAANSLSLNSWQHVAATYDGSMMRLYINGAQIDSNAISLSINSSLQNLTIGNWSYPTSNRAFAGSIDEVRIWNVKRSGAEILAFMNNEFCTSPSGLVAYYQLNEGIAGSSNSGLTTASDLSSNAQNGTLNNFALTGNASNWVTGSPINPAFDFVQISDSTCTNYISPTGMIYDSTGLFYDTLQNAEGCDSIIETNLTVNSVNDSVTVNSNILVAQQNNAIYQWLDCTNGLSQIPGATNQLLNPSDPAGSYAVIVNYRGCIDTSGCYQLTGIGLEEADLDRIQVYPNPGNGAFIIAHQGIYQASVLVYAQNGSLVKKQELTNSEESSLNLNSLPNGFYTIWVTNESYSIVKKLILNR